MESRSPQVVKPNRARQRELDWEDTRRPAWVAWLGGICAVALLVGIMVMAQSDRTSKPMNINGDQLGPFYMSDQAYEEHSRKLLDEAEGDEPRWALVSPAKAMAPKDFAKVFDIPHAERVRVSTLLIGPVVQRPIPEPAAGLRREDVFTIATEGLEGEDIAINGALVYAAPAELKAIAENPKVMAVEPAPVDAAYGRMGIRAVTHEES